MFLQRVGAEVSRLWCRVQTGATPGEKRPPLDADLPLYRAARPLPLRGAQQAAPGGAADLPITQTHLHERSRLSDKTLPIAFADHYFALQLPWLRSGACGLSDGVFMALGILQHNSDSHVLLGYLLERDLVGSRSLGRIRCDLFKDNLRGLRRLDLSFLPGYETRLCQLLRLHRAEYARYQLFARYIDEQADARQLLGRALQGRAGAGPNHALATLQQQVLQRERNIVWAKKERKLPPSLRFANAPLLTGRWDACPLLPAFRPTPAPQERSLQLYPPPPVADGVALPAY